jgi:hypothetical protein
VLLKTSCYPNRILSIERRGLVHFTESLEESPRVKSTLFHL